MRKPNTKASMTELAAEYERLGNKADMTSVYHCENKRLLGAMKYTSRWNGITMLCAHADTVSGCPGYDDRAGIAILLDVMESNPDAFAFGMFFDEEIGANGSRGLKIPENKVPLLFVGLDRRGVDHVAFYDDLSEALWSDWAKKNGGRPVQGSMTDCSVLGRIHNRDCLNLSVGFMNEHTPGETFLPEGSEFARRLLKTLIT